VLFLVADAHGDVRILTVGQRDVGDSSELQGFAERIQFAARSNDTLENHKTQLSGHMHQAKLVGVAFVSEVVDGRRSALVED